MQSPIDITSLLKAALTEDIGTGDITSLATIPADATARFAMNARQEMVACGLGFLPELMAMVDSSVIVEIKVEEGAKVAAGTTLATLSGSARALLSGERVALNMVQQLSGVATLTRQYVDAVAGTGSKILDTRKTVLGMREAQKYAVKCGGGQNHRMGLYDAVLIKDNHIAVAGGVAAAVNATRRYLDSLPHRGRGGMGALESPTELYNAPLLTSPLQGEEVKIEVECDTLAQLDEALVAGVDIVLLDNMNNDQLREAVAKVRAHNQRIMEQESKVGEYSLPHRGRAGVGAFDGESITARYNDSPLNAPLLTSPLQGEGLLRRHVKTEASGNVSLATVRGIAETGVDYISVGKLTHSAVAVDVGLDEV